MKPYSHLLFDLDNTLFDFQAAEAAAFQKTCLLLGLPYSSELMNAYTKINDSYWKLFELGKVSQQDLSVLRFADLYTYLNREGDALLANRCYRSCLSEQNKMFPETIPVCRRLSESYTLCLITNGIREVQEKRFSTSPLSRYISDVFVSETVGSRKPQKEFFNYVFHELNINPQKALVIGDSLTSDIRGAYNANIDSCWYNPLRKSNSCPELIPTYEINNLSQLCAILL